MANTWNTYSERTKERPPQELTVKAVQYAHAKDRALDLGPGALNETAYLLDQGFKSVIAVNKDPLETDPVAQAAAARLPSEHFEYRVSTFDAFDFEPNTYDFINAQYSLPFNPPETFDRMFTSIVASLKTGGIVTGQFFGPKDERNKGDGKMTFVTREKAEALLSDLEIIDFQEFKRLERLAVGGQNYGHTFHFIARKK